MACRQGEGKVLRCFGGRRLERIGDGVASDGAGRLSSELSNAMLD